MMTSRATVLPLLFLMTACGAKTGSSVVTNGGGTTPSGSKPTLAAWSVTPSALWTARLDLGNLTNSPFILNFSFSDGTTTQCTARLLGSQASGTYTVTSCTTDSSGMSSSTGTTPFDTAGAGTFANSGTVLTLCKNNSSCQTYN